MSATPRRARLRRILAPALAAVALAAALRLTVLAPAAVRVAVPTRRDLAVQVFGNGTVEARVVVPVASRITGRVVELAVDQGDAVRRGDLVARLDAADLEELVRQADASRARAAAAADLERASLAKARAVALLAAKDAGRLRALADQELVARQEADRAETALLVAEQEIARAEAALAASRHDAANAEAAAGAARARLAETRILAPRDGIVVSRDLEAGAVAAPGQPIVTIADPATVWVRAFVDEGAAGALAAGQAATITRRSSPGDPEPGRVARVTLQSDRATEELEVNVAFERPRGAFRIGEQADVLVTTGTRAGALAVPAPALVRRDGTVGVWVVRDRRAAFRPVEAGAADRAGFVEIVAGLAGGEQVVLPSPDRDAKLREGTRVRVGP